MGSLVWADCESISGPAGSFCMSSKLFSIPSHRQHQRRDRERADWGGLEMENELPR